MTWRGQGRPPERWGSDSRISAKQAQRGLWSPFRASPCNSRPWSQLPGGHMGLPACPGLGTGHLCPCLESCRCPHASPLIGSLDQLAPRLWGEVADSCREIPPAALESPTCLSDESGAKPPHSGGLGQVQGPGHAPLGTSCTSPSCLGLELGKRSWCLMKQGRGQVGKTMRVPSGLCLGPLPPSVQVVQTRFRAALGGAGRLAGPASGTG